MGYGPCRSALFCSSFPHHPLVGSTPFCFVHAQNVSSCLRLGAASRNPEPHWPKHRCRLAADKRVYIGASDRFDPCASCEGWSGAVGRRRRVARSLRRRWATGVPCISSRRERATRAHTAAFAANATIRKGSAVPVLPVVGTTTGHSSGHIWCVFLWFCSEGRRKRSEATVPARRLKNCGPSRTGPDQVHRARVKAATTAARG